jgi:Tetratricopeptide repeat/Leucine Rich repeat
MDQGDLAAALPLHERALAIREKVLGPEHPDTARSRENLARLIKETLCGNDIGAEGAQALKGLVNLISLDLRYNDIGAEGARHGPGQPHQPQPDGPRPSRVPGPPLRARRRTRNARRRCRVSCPVSLRALAPRPDVLCEISSPSSGGNFSLPVVGTPEMVAERNRLQQEENKRVIAHYKERDR